MTRKRRKTRTLTRDELLRLLWQDFAHTALRAFPKAKRFVLLSGSTVSRREMAKMAKRH